MAAAWLEHLGGGRVRVLSGGSTPASAVNPVAVTVMAEVGIDLSGRTPRVWTDAGLHSADVIVTMGCDDTCPFLPGKRYGAWGGGGPRGDGARRVGTGPLVIRGFPGLGRLLRIHGEPRLDHLVPMQVRTDQGLD